LWLVILILVVIAIALFFGGFTKGTKVGGMGTARAVAAAAQRPPLPLRGTL
jgi:hypothetical protein